MNNRPQLKVLLEDSLQLSEAENFAQTHGFELIQNGVCGEFDNLLVFAKEEIYVRFFENNTLLKVSADFIGGGVAHRRLYGGGKSQDIAKAVGLNKGFKPAVLDATAGLGKDGFVLATLGADVTLVERSPVVNLLLSSALKRAKLYSKESDQLLYEILGRINCVEFDSANYLESTDKNFDVIYLDPMFPERKKSALVKKEMRVFQEIVGPDEDADQLLAPAIDNAVYRVVVKRPKKAPFLANQPPTFQIAGKTSRFDIYVKKSIT